MKTCFFRVAVTVLSVGVGALACGSSQAPEATANMVTEDAGTASATEFSDLDEKAIAAAAELAPDGRVYLSDAETEWVDAVDLVRMNMRRPSRWTPYEDLNPAIAIVEAIPVYSTGSDDAPVAFFDGTTEHPTDDFETKLAEAREQLAEDNRTPKALRDDT